MENFKKLSREEMKKVNGGGLGTCTDGGECSFYVGEIGNGGGYMDGICSAAHNCYCVNGGLSGPSSQCFLL
jgi:hypothetical protein